MSENTCSRCGGKVEPGSTGPFDALKKRDGPWRHLSETVCLSFVEAERERLKAVLEGLRLLVQNMANEPCLREIKSDECADGFPCVTCRARAALGKEKP